MAFTPKDWRDSPTATTPLSAAALEDLEARLAAYADSIASAGTDAAAIHNTIIDAKGDLIAGTADNTPARLAAGTNGYVLTADSTATPGVKWAAAAAASVGVAAPTGTAATDTAAIQNAINAAATAGGGSVVLQAGTYVVTNITLKSLVRIVGQGQYSTTIKLANSTNTAVITGENFASLTTTNSNAGIYGAGIEQLTVDGNKANNTSGTYGVNIYGYDNHFEDVRIFNCKGIGLYSEWGLTSAVSSDTLATGGMECHAYNLRIDRNDGGGIDWYGPSDSVFIGGNIAKNGPTSGSTTNAICVRGNSFTCQFTNYHVWGTTHKYGWKLDVACILTGCSAEGADTGNVWLRAGGQQLDLKLYNPGANVDYGLILGDTAGTLFSGDNVIKAKFKDCGIDIQKDSGGNVFELSYYWSDDTKTFITTSGSPGQNTARSNYWRIMAQPLDAAHAAVGTINSIGRIAASVNDAKRLSGQRWAVNGGVVQNIPRWSCDKDQTGMVSASGKVFAHGGLTIGAWQTISSATFLVGATAYAAATGGHLWAAMWDASTLALLAQSTDDTSGTGAMPANARKTFDFATPYTSNVDRDVYVGIGAAGATGFVSPSFWGSFLGNSYIAQEAPAISILPATTGLTTTAPNPLVLTSAAYTTKVIYVSLA